MHIHVLSPYRRQFAYPSFWKLLSKLSNEHTVCNPVDSAGAGMLRRAYDTKLKHIMPLLSSLWTVVKTRTAPDVFVTFGTYQIGFVVLLRLLFPRARFITYQPELFEFDSPLLTKMFCAAAHRYDLFVDVEPMRLKLRRRYFSKMRTTRAAVLPNFDHRVEQIGQPATSTGRFVYAGVIDSEASLVRMCGEFGVSTEAIDCYVTKYLDRQRPVRLQSLEPRPFNLIAQQGYRFGFICYPFVNGTRRSLNNKYCAPSKLFSYLAYGIYPVHYAHPTLKAFVRAGISIDRPTNFAAVCADNRAAISNLFDEMATQVASTTEAIIETIQQSELASPALHRIRRG